MTAVPRLVISYTPGWPLAQPTVASFHCRVLSALWRTTLLPVALAPALTFILCRLECDASFRCARFAQGFMSLCWLHFS